MSAVDVHSEASEVPAPVSTSRDGTPFAVRLTSLTKTFGDNVVLDRLDLDIAPGEFVVLLGPSGTGKTTLLRVLSGLEEADSGEVLVPPVRTTVYQEPRLIQARRVLQNVTLGQRSSAENKAAALAALGEVGLGDRSRSWPATLSGGEAQRVALARALVRQPQLLLLDEPFAALDALTRLQMQDLVGALFLRHQPAVVLVTHDVDEAVTLADRVLILRDGRFATDVRIDDPHPRDRTSVRFLDFRRTFLRDLGVEETGARLAT